MGLQRRVDVGQQTLMAERRIVDDPFDDWPPRESRPASRPPPTSESPADQPAEPPVIVPPDALSAATLDALIEEFVTRHGTELSDAGGKVNQVRALLRSGKVQIVFDPNTESCNIAPVASTR